ncbi:hypothetical protein LTR33_011395 [Friedmanniomyces endolithicus]|nr:hypothetical protein LTR33_011395 [Friedmanniomyces endolithicus]
MIYASAEALSTSLLPEEVKANWLYPDIRRIREVSVEVTRGVIRAAQADKLDRELALRNISDEELDEFIRNRMYDPYTEHDKVNAELKDLAQHVMGSPMSPAGQANGNGKMASRPGTAEGSKGWCVGERRFMRLDLAWTLLWLVRCEDWRWEPGMYDPAA